MTSRQELFAALRTAPFTAALVTCSLAVREAAEKGRQYVVSHHSPDAVAEAYERAIAASLGGSASQ